MKKLVAIAFISGVVFCSGANANTLPDAVCGNGEVTGNPHCVTKASISSIPMPGLSSGPFSITLLILSGVVGWLINKNKK